MKKLGVLLLSLALLLALAGCSGEKTKEENSGASDNTTTIENQGQTEQEKSDSFATDKSKTDSLNKEEKKPTKPCPVSKSMVESTLQDFSDDVANFPGEYYELKKFTSYIYSEGDSDTIVMTLILEEGSIEIDAIQNAIATLQIINNNFEELKPTDIGISYLGELYDYYNVSLTVVEEKTSIKMYTYNSEKGKHLPL